MLEEQFNSIIVFLTPGVTAAEAKGAGQELVS